jgi:hypothetical protein
MDLVRLKQFLFPFSGSKGMKSLCYMNQITFGNPIIFQFHHNLLAAYNHLISQNLTNYIHLADYNYIFSRKQLVMEHKIIIGRIKESSFLERLVGKT